MVDHAASQLAPTPSPLTPSSSGTGSAPVDFLEYWKTGARELTTFRGHSHGVWSVAFAPDGLTLASGGVDRLVRMWDIETGRLLRSLRGHTRGYSICRLHAGWPDAGHCQRGPYHPAVESEHWRIEEAPFHTL